MRQYLLGLLGLYIAAAALSAAATECGKQQISKRIYGGSNAILGEWPWHVTLSYLGEPYCGATLISEQWLVTAAHCFAGNKSFSDPALWKADLSFTILNGAPEPQMVVRGLKQILVHEKYTNFINGFDIAVVQLSEPVAFSKTIGPVCLPLSNHRFRLRSSCWVTGLEDVQQGGNLSSARPLQQVSITLIGRKACNCIYNSLGRVEISNPVLTGMICGTDKDGLRGPCSGDSGGPVVCNEDGVWFIAGIVSFSLGCHLPNSPTVFTEVSTYASWIQNKMATAGAADVAFFANQTISVSGIPEDDNNCTDLISTKNPGCGIPKVNLTEPGGLQGQFPWSVGLFFQGNYMCEGTLISESWLLAAAHCFVGPNVSESTEDWTAALGNPPNMVRLKRISINGAFIAPPEGRDLAMLELEQPLVFGDYLQPVCVPVSEHRFRFGTTCAITDHNPGAGTELQKTDIQLIGPNQCNCIYSQAASAKQSVSLLPGMICAAPEEGNTSTCQGEVGGPLVCNEDGAWFLAGLYSFGGVCAQPDSPAVYTQVTAFEEYIHDTTREAYFAPQVITVPPGLDNGNCSDASDSVCGQPADSARKPGTGDAPEGAWPWIVSFEQYGSHRCSGVLIGKRWVLCDSHCFSNFPLFEKDYTVYLGQLDDTSPTEFGISRKLIRVVHHPNFKRGSDDNYLTLAELSPDVIYSNAIRPVCLPTADVHVAIGSNCWATGWGDSQPSESFPVSNALKELEKSVLSADNCSCQYEEGDSPSNATLARTICAGNTLEPTPACLDDSGIPLVCQDSAGAWLLAGLASSRAGCIDPPCPTVYTAAAPFDAWIRETVSGDAQFINSAEAFPLGNTTEGPKSSSTTTVPHTTSEAASTMNTTHGSTVGNQSASTATVSMLSTATEGSQGTTTSQGTLGSSTSQGMTTTRGTSSTSQSQGVTTARSQETSTTTGTLRTVASRSTGTPATGGGVVSKPTTARPAAASQDSGSLLLYCIMGVLYLMFASW